MKLVRPGGSFAQEGPLEELAETVAQWRIQDADYISRFFARLSEGDWMCEPAAADYIELVTGTGLELLEEDSAPTSLDTVAELGRQAWRHLQAIYEMQTEEEEIPPDTQPWP